MSLATNTGNAFLDSYARQINRLENDPNATPEYDKALEQQFAAIKAQVLGSGDDKAATPGGKDGTGSSHGSSSASGSGGGGGSSATPPGTTSGGSGARPPAPPSSAPAHGTGSGGGSSATPPGTTSGGSGPTPPVPPSSAPAHGTGSGGGSSATPPGTTSGGSGGTGSDGSPSVDDFVAKLSTTVNPETGDAVKKIADDAGKSIGGSDGDAVARMSAEAERRRPRRTLPRASPRMRQAMPRRLPKRSRTPANSAVPKPRRMSRRSPTRPGPTRRKRLTTMARSWRSASVSASVSAAPLSSAPARRFLAPLPWRARAPLRSRLGPAERLGILPLPRSPAKPPSAIPYQKLRRMAARKKKWRPMPRTSPTWPPARAGPLPSIRNSL